VLAINLKIAYNISCSVWQILYLQV
jgi:hypothetical protein